VPERDARRPMRRIRGSIGVAVSALVVAAFTAIGTGLGSKALHAFDHDESALVTASAREEIAECGTPLFAERNQARAILATKPGVDWLEFMRAHDARVAEQNVVTVSIQGESSRAITLTGIHFDVERRSRPPGAVFANPCGGGITGRSVLADLDRTPVAIINSNDDPRRSLDPTQRPTHPIRFPWTVSVTDPLLLTIIAVTRNCSCTWRASLDWASGDKSGTLHVDDGGRGYTVVGTEGLRTYLNGGAERGWQPLR
jgi:hypothetical protein